MTLFLIGGTGFIGRHVTRRLVERGHAVTVFHRGETTPDLPSAVETVHGNRDDTEALRAALDAAAPDGVLDIIPYTEAQAEALVEAQPPFDWRYAMATDTRRLRTELGFAEPVGHAEALRRTIAWAEEARNM